MSKIPWKENKVLSIETRKGLFVLAQMIKEPYLVFYNLFSQNQEWKNVDIDKQPVLFYTAVAREFINSSNIITQKILASKRSDLDKLRIHVHKNYRNITLWKGTHREIEFLIMGEGGMLIEKDPYGSGFTEDQKIIKKNIDSDDNETIDKHDLDRILFYPGLNERLYLSYNLGKNVDPLKDFEFNRKVPVEYEVYAKLYSNKITEKEWLKLPL